MLYTKVLSFIEDKELIHPGDHVILGISGGPDSVCLLSLCREMCREGRISLEAVHVNHEIRGEEALEDEHFTEDLCRKWQVPLTVYRKNVPEIGKAQGIGLEEAGRMVRQGCFQERAKAWKGPGEALILLAQHKKDNAETMLLHLFRGSGIAGLGGIAPRRGNIIRPLLDVSREEIMEYLQEHQIPFRVDSSNGENVYARNQIRNEILPKITAINARGEEHIAQTAEDLKAVQEYLESQGRALWEKYGEEQEGRKSIPVAVLVSAPQVVRRELLRQMVEGVRGNLVNIGRAQLLQVEGLLGKIPGKKVLLPGNVMLYREYDFLVAEEGKEEREAFPSFSVDVPGTYEIPGEEKKISFRILPYTEGEQEIPKTACRKWFDYDKIRDSLWIRTREEGDYLSLKTGKKSLHRYYIDEKIPVMTRDFLWFLAEGHHILWIPGGQISEYYKVESSTRRVLEVNIVTTAEDE